MIGKSFTYNLIFFCAVLAGYFAFTDLQISKLIVDRQAGWAIFLQRFGELPGLLVLFSGTHIYLSKYTPAFKLKKIFVLAFLYSAAIYLSRFIFVVIYSGFTGNYLLIDNNFWTLILTFAVLNIIVFALVRKVNFTERILRFGKVSVLLGLFGYLLSVQPIKHLWGRVRFRDLDSLYSAFTPWFIPNGINGNTSFPSGHSAMAWMILPLLILVPVRNKISRSILLLIIIAWGLAVSLSRIVAGAHYASDVLFSACIVIFIFTYLHNKYFIRNL